LTLGDQLRIEAAPEPVERENRCTPRKHVVEKGMNNWCDCGKVMLGMTAAGNAHVVTINGV
jgi:hypothetical protein